MITLADIKHNPEIFTLVNWANEMLDRLGYTEHGPRHTGYVSKMASDILMHLGYDARTVELAAITGWIHDVGNAVNRKHHGLTGAAMLFPILRDMGMDIKEICEIVAAIGNHEEQTGSPLTAIASAVILADKCDAHRTRVRRGKRYDSGDIHDRVNYSIRSNTLVVDPKERVIRFVFEMDETSSVMEFMQIYLTRMLMSEKAAHFLNCRFELVVNNMRINNHDAFAPETTLIKEEE